MPGLEVAVLMPVKHYHASYVRVAMDSLARQTDPNWRLLVIAERSGRRELEELVSERGVYERAEVIVNTGRGLAGALNTGMWRAGSEFVAILLGDDAWTPDAVAVLRERIASRPDADFLHSSRRIVDDRGRPISSVHLSRPNVRVEDFCSGSSPVKHLLCWRRELGLAIGGIDESLPPVGIDDFDFPWSMAEAGAAFVSIPECLYVYRDHRESFRLTTHLPLATHRRGLAAIMRKHGVDEEAIESTVARAERGYLRQCLYRSQFDRRLKALGGYDTRDGWRERYV